MASLTYRDALRRALEEAMTEDEDIVVIGEEVGRYGGAYGVTKDLIKTFGPERMIDTPISEAAIVGMAVGAAMTGLRPVAELMYVDFLGMSMDQLANQAAKIRYMFGGQIGVPMVLRMQGGTGRSAGAQHSQSLEAWVMHTPGLRLAMPATVADAYHLLRHSLTVPDPVVFIEHKALYAHKEEVDLAAPVPAWGKAAIRRTGDDLVIVTYSRQVHYAHGRRRQAGRGRHRGHGHRPAHAQSARFRHGARRSRTRRQGDGGQRRRAYRRRRRRARRPHRRGMLRFPRTAGGAGRRRGRAHRRVAGAGSGERAGGRHHPRRRRAARPMVSRILTMPRLGETMEEGRIVAWLVKPGADFKRGDAIIEIETDKTVVEFPALADGRLSATLAGEGDQVAVGAPLAHIEIGEATDWPDIFGEGEAAPAPAAAAPAPVVPPPQDARRRATPLARRLARQRGLDIETIAGSGRRGRIEKADVLAAAAGAAAPAGAAEADDVRFVEVAGGRLAYVASGPADGAPILLIHGFAADHTAWAAVATQLARAGRRVVALDLPGHGATTLPAATVADLGAPLGAALDRLPAAGRFEVVAHSLGAAAAVALAGARPDRVASLTLVAPAGLGLEIDGGFVLGMARATSAAEVGHLLRRISARGVGLSDVGRVAVARAMATGRLRDLAEDAVGPSGQRVDILPAVDKLARAMPVRVIFGVADRIIPWQQVSTLPASVAIHLIAGAGHMPHWDEPRAFLAVVGGGSGG